MVVLPVHTTFSSTGLGKHFKVERHKTVAKNKSYLLCFLGFFFSFFFLQTIGQNLCVC